MRHTVYDLPTSFEQASAWLGGAARKTVAHNTDLARGAAGEIDLIFHNSRIVTFLRDDSLLLNSNGYRTVTTKQRLNAVLGDRGRVSQVKGEWYYRDSGLRHEGGPWQDITFHDGLIVDSHGLAIGAVL